MKCRKCLRVGGGIGGFEPDRRVCRECRNHARRNRKRSVTIKVHWSQKIQQTFATYRNLLHPDMIECLSYCQHICRSVTNIDEVFPMMGGKSSTDLIRGIVKKYAPYPLPLFDVLSLEEIGPKQDELKKLMTRVSITYGTPAKEFVMIARAFLVACQFLR